MSYDRVVIAGAGPTGLVLAGELALAGVDVVVLERRTGRDLVGSRAGGLTARSLEVLDQRGIVERFLAAGTLGQIGHYAGLFFDVADLPTRHHYGLALLQYRIEQILADWVTELGVDIGYGRAVSGFTQDAGGVAVRTEGGATVRGGYLVGCDGGRSTVRKTAGIGFPGVEASTSCLVADVSLTAEPPWGLHRAGGFHAFFRFAGEDTVRVMVTEPRIGTAEPTLADIAAALHTARGTDYGLRSAAWISRFTDTTRQAADYRDRRVLLAGDAAHVHFPIGGQGLNTGIQDAVNLGWKLGRVLAGAGGEQLLDSYHRERHPVAARVLRHTMAQTALNGPGGRVDALRDTVSELLALPEVRHRIAALMCGLDIRYAPGAASAHPLLGRRIPDLDLRIGAGRTRVFALLHDARGLLLRFGEIGEFDCRGWPVSVVAAATEAPWILPVLGEIPAPDAVLIRPDGHVAWVGEGSTAGLRQALDTWFG